MRLNSVQNLSEIK